MSSPRRVDCVKSALARRAAHVSSTALGSPLDPERQHDEADLDRPRGSRSRDRSGRPCRARRSRRGARSPLVDGAVSFAGPTRKRRPRRPPRRESRVRGPARARNRAREGRHEIRLDVQEVGCFYWGGTRGLDTSRTKDCGQRGERVERGPAPREHPGVVPGHRLVHR